MTSVYKHTFPNGKIYIGITENDVKRRWQNGKGYKYNEPMYKDICKYGWDNITHEVLYECATREEAEIIECGLIKKYGSTSPDVGYNIASYAKFSNVEHINASQTFSYKCASELVEILRNNLAEKDKQIEAMNKQIEAMNKHFTAMIEILKTSQSTTSYYQNMCIELKKQLTSKTKSRNVMNLIKMRLSNIWRCLCGA